MGDSSMSASELRNRYHQGGSAGDADLSASQLRARYGIASNRAGGCRRPSSFASNASLVDNSLDASRRPGALFACAAPSPSSVASPPPTHDDAVPAQTSRRAARTGRTWPWARRRRSW
jgi:hypothetical protein